MSPRPPWKTVRHPLVDVERIAENGPPPATRLSTRGRRLRERGSRGGGMRRFRSLQRRGFLTPDGSPTVYAQNLLAIIGLERTFRALARGTEGSDR